MSRLNRKIVLIGLAVTGALVAIATSVIAQSGSQPTDSDRSMQKKRLAAAKRTYELLVEAPVHAGHSAAGPEETYRWSTRWMEAEGDAATDPTARRSAREAHVMRMKKLEDRVKQKFRAGEAPESDVSATEFYRLDAEDWHPGTR